MVPWVSLDLFFSWTVVRVTRKLEFEDVEGRCHDKFQWVITITVVILCPNSKLTKTSRKSDASNPVLLRHNLANARYCYWKSIIKWYPTKRQLLDYFHQKQTFLLKKMILKRQKKLKKEEKKRMRWSHCMRQSDSRQMSILALRKMSGDICIHPIFGSSFVFSQTNLFAIKNVSRIQNQHEVRKSVRNKQSKADIVEIVIRLCDRCLSVHKESFFVGRKSLFLSKSCWIHFWL